MHSKIIFFVSIILVGASCSPIYKYKKDPGVLKWEKDIQAFEKVDSATTDPADALLFTGSSSIRLWENIHEDMKPYDVVQRGYGGAKLSDFAVYSKRIIYPHHPKAIVLFLANDISGAEDDKSPREVFNLYRYVVQQVRKKMPNEPIYFIQITPTNSRWKVWDTTNTANKLIADYATKDSQLYYIETAPAILGADGKPRAELFREDQLHLNEEGYKIWADVIKTALNKSLN